MGAIEGTLNFLGAMGTSLIGAASNKRNVKRTNETNLQIARETNAQNQRNWQAEFDYQKYLNQNQHQIESQDLKKAGINPIVGAGGGLSAFGGNTNTATAATMQAPDTMAAYNSIAQAFLQNKQIEAQKDIAKANNETQKDIAKESNETQKDIAEINAETSKYSTDTSKEIADANRESQKMIAKLDRESREKVTTWNNQATKDLEEIRQKWQDSDDHALALQKIQRLQQNAQRDHELALYMQNAKVAIKDATGEVKQLTIEDALKYAEFAIKMNDQSTANRVFNYIIQGIGAARR